MERREMLTACSAGAIGVAAAPSEAIEPSPSLSRRERN